jgi:lipopolysaccharide transport system ATP-binding protein
VQPKTELTVRARGLSKVYEIRHNAEMSTTAAEALVSRLRHPLRRAEREQFSALRDINFDVHQGDVLGVIGRNGAGKSTLLKVLSRITPPSAGRVEVWGRVGSLLEVGTGFHPELTGRENIFLNGAILGMNRAEVRRHFDEIVEFAGVERFLDTPVKRYSSGMYIRLAFAVAAHLDVDVLLVDEVLAVGDLEFQNKCLGRMKDVAAHGRAVMFVSHQMNSVAALCTRAIVLDQGRIVFHGDVPDAVRSYQESFARSRQVDHRAADRPGTGEARVIEVRPAKPVFSPEDEKCFEIDVDVLTKSSETFALSATFVNEIGIGIVECDMRHAGVAVSSQGTGASSFLLRLRTPWLRPGRYRVDVKIHRIGPWVDVFDGAAEFEVVDILPYEFGAPVDAGAAGVTLPDFDIEQL